MLRTPHYELAHTRRQQTQASEGMTEIENSPELQNDEDKRPTRSMYFL